MSPTYPLVGAGILVLLAGLSVWPTFADSRPLPRRRRTATWCVVGALVLLLAAGLLAQPDQSSSATPALADTAPGLADTAPGLLVAR